MSELIKMNILRDPKGRLITEEELAEVNSKEYCPNCGEKLEPDSNYPLHVKVCRNCWYEWNPFGM